MGNQLAKSQKMLLKLNKPRNPLVAPALLRKAGAHRKSTSAERLAQNRLLQKMLKGEGDDK